jgi:hypothetical protein
MSIRNSYYNLSGVYVLENDHPPVQGELAKIIGEKKYKQGKRKSGNVVRKKEGERKRKK